MTQPPVITMPRRLEPMLPCAAPPAGVYSALGSGILPSWFLRALCPALAGGTPLTWIDAGNSFDAYGLSRTAQAMGLDPRPVLGRISLARPFNAYQLEAMVRRKVAASWRGEPVVLSDPLGPFYDEDLPERDVFKTLGGVIQGLRGLPAIWLMLLVIRRAPAGRASVLKAFTGESVRLAMLTPEDQPALKALDRASLDRSGELPAGFLAAERR